MAKISTYLIGIVMFTLFIVGGLFLINSIAEYDDSFINHQRYEQFEGITNQYEKLEESMSGLAGGILDEGSVDQSTIGVLSSLIQTAWNGLKALPTTFLFMNTMILNLSIFFGVPSFIPGLLLLIITIIVLFSILGAVFQNDI